METLLYHVMSTMGCYLKVGVAVSRVLKVQSACGGEVQGNGPKQHPLLPEAAGGLPKLGRRMRKCRRGNSTKRRIEGVRGVLLTGQEGYPRSSRKASL